MKARSCLSDETPCGLWRVIEGRHRINKEPQRLSIGSVIIRAYDPEVCPKQIRGSREHQFLTQKYSIASFTAKNYWRAHYRNLGAFYNVIKDEKRTVTEGKCCCSQTHHLNLLARIHHKDCTQTVIRITTCCDVLWNILNSREVRKLILYTAAIPSHFDSFMLVLTSPRWSFGRSRTKHETPGKVRDDYSSIDHGLTIGVVFIIHIETQPSYFDCLEKKYQSPNLISVRNCHIRAPKM